MSVDKWAFIPQKCIGEDCPGDCEDCPRQALCPPGINEDGDCANDADMCPVCWKTFGPEVQEEESE